MATPKKKSPRRSARSPSRKRRTHAERSAETQRRLFDAAVDLLYTEGYSATTTISVAKRAKVSRGAMLHQYPTREKLLLTVAEQIAEGVRGLWQDALRNNESKAERPNQLRAAGELSWQVFRRPTTIAMIEIMLATRSDAKLRKGFEPITRASREWRRKLARRLASDLNTDQVDLIEDFIALHQVCMRGIAIELLFAKNRADVERLRNMQRDYESQFLARIANTTRK